ncbi:ATP-binding protein [Dyadobacter sp. SG02]|uniref:ATP-binding protein n=1 Tax=Dyadobacter sp. SG02 TaxID=1855291 RepID=UPI0015A69C6A|nr:ATP-binding protein [Dyadobacter sp. SG02]
MSLTLHAEENESWTVTHFNSENGLPQNSVNSALMDDNGYLWFTTQAGIVRYDGQHFRLFDNSNSGLRRNRFLSLGKCNDGRLFCIDDNVEISYYDHRNGFSKPQSPTGLLGSMRGILRRFDEFDLGPMTRYTEKFMHTGFSDILTFSFFETRNGKGFIIKENLVAGYVSNGKVRRVDSLDINRNMAQAIGSVGDKLCYFSRAREIVLLDSNGVRTRKKVPIAIPWDKLERNRNTAYFCWQNEAMVLNIDGAIYEVMLSGGEVEFRHLATLKQIPYITSVRYYPRQGLLIVGSNTDGVYILRRKQLGSVGKNALNADAFYALAPYGDNQVLSVTGSLPGSPSVPGVEDSYNRYSLLRDRDRHYWYSSATTLLEADEQFRVLRKIPLTGVLSCLGQDEKGTIWMMEGEVQFGRRKNRFARVRGNLIEPYPLQGIEGKNMQSFIPMGNQTFWIVGTGLCMWVDAKNRKQRIYHEFDDVELRTVYRDKLGNVWMGSYGQGYYLFRNGRFTKMPEDEAHHLKIVHSFVEDRKGFIWMSTNNGLFQCSLNDFYDYASGKSKQVYHHYYGKESGLKTTEFNGGCSPSALRMASGRFAFPSMNGVVVFHPDSIKTVLPDSKIFIEQVMLDGTPASRQALLQIAPSFKRLELTVSSPYFGSPNNLNIQYNVEGLDDRWYPLPENNRIVLNTLQHGGYKLRLRKEAGFGTLNYITAELPLVVMPFFYQTWWFYLLVLALIVASVIVIVKMRYRYLLRQRNRLEAEVNERTQELAYQSKLMEKLTVSIAHDLKSPLYFLSKVTGHLRDNVQRENFNGIERTSSEIKNTADQLYQFAEEFNLWASSFTQGFSVNKTSFPLDDLLQELRLFFREMLDANGNRLTFAADTHYTLHTDRELLKVILRNIIDNANKHSRECEITISATGESAGNVALTIADTGGGMSEPVLKRIQDRIAQASTAAGIERNGRLGYQMIIDFANRLDAKLNVRSERGAGTSVTLQIQWKENSERLSPGLAQQVVGAG